MKVRAIILAVIATACGVEQEHFSSDDRATCEAEKHSWVQYVYKDPVTCQVTQVKELGCLVNTNLGVTLKAHPDAACVQDDAGAVFCIKGRGEVESEAAARNQWGTFEWLLREHYEGNESFLLETSPCWDEISAQELEFGSPVEEMPYVTK